MFGIGSKRIRRSARQRALRVEGLETRWMLAGDTGEVIEAGAAAVDADWPGFLVSDLSGNIMFADVEDTFQTDLLGATSLAPYDIAVSSEGRLLAVGGPSNSSSVLYELNVDFDNPGGFNDPTPISWIIADGNPVWMNSLEFVADGTLLGTGFHYQGVYPRNSLYSLDIDTAQATVLVDLYGYQAFGDVTADEDGVVYCTTLDGSLLAISADYSGFSVVGDLGATDVNGMTYGPGPELRGYRSDGTVLNIDPSDASSFVEGTLSTTTIPSPNMVLGATTVFKPPTNLGEVEFVELTEQTATLEQLWYRFDAMNDGYVSVGLDDLSTTSGLEMALYREDLDGDLEEIATGTTRIDYESAEAGDRYFVEITGLQSEATVRVGNQVEPGIDTLTIHGSSEGDVVELAIASPYMVDVNGLDYAISFAGAAHVTTTFDGDGGDDLFRVLGSDGDDAAHIDMATRSGNVTGLGFEVRMSSTSTMEFDGREGHDTAEILGTDVDSELHVAPFACELVEGSVHGTVLHAEQISIDAAGGEDHVIFEGGPNADRLDLNPTFGMYREYVPSDEVRDPTWSTIATNIESNYASSGGGIDGVFMRDSAGDETFVAETDLVTYEGPGYSHEIHGFRHALAYGLNGGFDTATMYDTEDNDKFKGLESFGLLRGADITIAPRALRIFKRPSFTAETTVPFSTTRRGMTCSPVRMRQPP